MGDSYERGTPVAFWGFISGFRVEGKRTSDIGMGRESQADSIRVVWYVTCPVLIPQVENLACSENRETFHSPPQPAREEF